MFVTECYVACFVHVYIEQCSSQGKQTFSVIFCYVDIEVSADIAIRTSAIAEFNKVRHCDRIVSLVCTTFIPFV